MTTKILTIVIGIFLSLPVLAQRQLKVEGGLDTTGISTKIINGKATARVIFESGIELHYSTNMEEQLPDQQIGKVKNKSVYSDTLYFFPTLYDNTRIIYLEAEGYFKQKIGPIKIMPKTTSKYIVYDPVIYARKNKKKVASFDVAAGTVSLAGYSSIGIKSGIGMNIHLYKSLAITPEVNYNRLYIKSDGYGELTRNYIETNVYLKYGVWKFLNIYAGYSQTFVDYNSCGISLIGELKIYKKLSARVYYNYYFDFSDSLYGVGIGYHI